MSRVERYRQKGWGVRKIDGVTPLTVHARLGGEGVIGAHRLPLPQVHLRWIVHLSPNGLPSESVLSSRPCKLLALARTRSVMYDVRSGLGKHGRSQADSHSAVHSAERPREIPRRRQRFRRRQRQPRVVAQWTGGRRSESGRRRSKMLARQTDASERVGLGGMRVYQAFLSP